MKRGWAGIALSALALLAGPVSAHAQAPSNDHWPGTPISVPAHETLPVGEVFGGQPGAFELVPGGCVSDPGGDAQLNGLRLAPNTTYSIELATWSEPQSKDDAVLGVTSSPVYAVTKTADLSDGTCNADCSLREAISAANAAAGAVLIPKGIYKLAGAAGEDANTSGDLDVLAGYNIYGAGPDETVIDAQGEDRVLHTPDEGRPFGAFGISGLTLRKRHR
jgi:CSLREA domain-containing protein